MEFSFLLDGLIPIREEIRYLRSYRRLVEHQSAQVWIQEPLVGV